MSASLAQSLKARAGRLWTRRTQLQALTLTSLLLVVLFRTFSAWQLLEAKSFDVLSTIHPPGISSDGPVIVAIDEPSLAEINTQWPWPRSLHAKLVRQLRAAGAKAIGIDIIFAEPSNTADDEAFAAAMQQDVVLAGDETLIRTPQADQLVRATPLPQFGDAGASTGIASVSLGGDGVFRRLPEYIDGFAASLFQISQGQRPDVPADALIQSFGPARAYPTVSYYQALDPEKRLPKDIFKDRVVLVGLSLQNAPEIHQGGGDTFATPFTMHTGKLTAGVELQATIYENLVRRLYILEGGTAVAIVTIVLAAMLAALVVWRSTGWLTVIAGFCSVLFFGVMSYMSIRYGHLFVSPLGPTVAFTSVAIGQATFDYSDERRRKKLIIRAFSQYLSPDLVRRLADDPAQLKLGGERRTLSILFSDVRGFTTIAETMKDDPEQLTLLINQLLTPLSDVVMNMGGTIDKYMGDCIMAFWNAPLDDPNHALHAVEAAIAMQAALAALNADLAAQALAERTNAPVLRMGIGINTGECVVGNMGSDRRFDYSCLGDSVNLASRLEGASKNYGVALLLGAETARQVSSVYRVLELDRIVVKGRTAASPIFTVAADATDEGADEHQRFLLAKYAGLLAPDDAAFETLPVLIPSLAAYYDLVRCDLPTVERHRDNLAVEAPPESIKSVL